MGGEEGGINRGCWWSAGDCRGLHLVGLGGEKWFR